MGIRGGEGQERAETRALLDYAGHRPAIAWNTVSESTVLGFPNLAWSLEFLQSAQDFLNHLVTVIRSTERSPLAQQMFFTAYGAVRTRNAPVPR